MVRDKHRGGKHSRWGQVDKGRRGHTRKGGGAPERETKKNSTETKN